MKVLVSSLARPECYALLAGVFKRRYTCTYIYIYICVYIYIYIYEKYVYMYLSNMFIKVFVTVFDTVMVVRSLGLISVARQPS